MHELHGASREVKKTLFPLHLSPKDWTISQTVFSSHHQLLPLSGSQKEEEVLI